MTELKFKEMIKKCVLSDYDEDEIIRLAKEAGYIEVTPLEKFEMIKKRYSEERDFNPTVNEVFTVATHAIMYLKK